MSANQLYHVYLWDENGGNDGNVVLDFWRAYTGVGVEGWSPIVNELGIYVKSTSGGVGIDNTRTYVGMVWTGGSDISTTLSGSNIKLPVASHMKLWRFPFVSDLSTVSSFTATTMTAQSNPSCLFVTTGITDTGYFLLHCSHYNGTSGQVGEIRLDINGTDYQGNSFTQSTVASKATTPAINGYVNLTASFGAAIPMGVYTVTPSIRVNGGTGTFEIYMTGYVAE